MQTPEGFRSLAQLLAPQVSQTAPQADEEPLNEPLHDLQPPGDDDLVCARDARLFHARILEAVDDAVDTLLERIAHDVLARELQLAPADVERIVDRALRRFAAEDPLRVRLHPADAAAIPCNLPTVADEALQRGDAVLELRGATVDARLSVRLECVLAERAP